VRSRRELRAATTGVVAAPRRLRATFEGAGEVDIGDDVVFAAGPVQSHVIVDHQGLVTIGDHVRIGHGAAISCTNRVSIGAGTRIEPFVAIMDSDFHVAGATRTRPRPGTVVIGRDVRIGADVTILRNTSIGDGAVVESGSVVWGVVPPGGRIVENPKASLGA
jgi:acetyltransferase-like isoleucine patch superfamily enzyme